MKHDAFIDRDSCPNLTIINKHNWDGGIEWGNPEENQIDGQETLNKKLNQKHELNQQVKDLLTKIEKEEINSFQEFINSFQGQDFEFTFDNLNEECQAQFTKTFVPKLEEHVKNLINNFSQMSKDEFLNKVEQITPFKAYLTDELREKLFNLIQSINSAINPQSNEKNHWPLIIGTISLSVLIIGVMFWFIDKLVQRVFKHE